MLQYRHNKTMFLASDIATNSKVRRDTSQGVFLLAPNSDP